MAGIAGAAVEGERSPWSLRALYAPLLVSALALLTLVAQDVVSWIEEHRGGHGELHHLFIFDLAWPVFLLSTLLTLIAAVVALVCGRLRASTRLTR